MALCSIGMAAGILGVVALVKGVVLRRRLRYLAYGGYEGDCGGRAHRGWGPFGGFGGRGFGGRGGGFGRSFWLRGLFAKLDTTPGQEREIRAALEDLADRGRDAKAGIKESRESIGRAVGGEVFDESAFEAVTARVDATSEKMKDAFGAALRRVHAVLDPKQRERLADLLASGWGRGGFGRGGGGFGGPYRGGAEL